MQGVQILLNGQEILYHIPPDSCEQHHCPVCSQAVSSVSFCQQTRSVQKAPWLFRGFPPFSPRRFPGKHGPSYLPYRCWNSGNAGKNLRYWRQFPPTAWLERLFLFVQCTYIRSILAVFLTRLNITMRNPLVFFIFSAVHMVFFSR